MFRLLHIQDQISNDHENCFGYGVVGICILQNTSHAIRGSAYNSNNTSSSWSAIMKELKRTL